MNWQLIIAGVAVVVMLQYRYVKGYRKGRQQQVESALRELVGILINHSKNQMGKIQELIDAGDRVVVAAKKEIDRVTAVLTAGEPVDQQHIDDLNAVADALDKVASEGSEVKSESTE